MRYGTADSAHSAIPLMQYARQPPWFHENALIAEPAAPPRNRRNM